MLITESGKTCITANGAVCRSTSSFNGQVNISLFHSRSCDMASKWNGQPCPLCGAGTLHDGIKAIEQAYKGQVFKSQSRGAFCDHCADGFVEFDQNEDSAWLAFRDQV